MDMDLIGERFGRLLVVSKGETVEKYDGRRNRYFRYWNVLCDCGSKKSIRQDSLRSGLATSCGCLRAEEAAKRARKAFKTHGMTQHPRYGTWKSMMNRCENPNDRAYKNYGGRGISVTEEWRGSPENFLAWAEQQEHCNNKKFSLDRVDVNGNYEPSNCRFANDSTQGLNRRSSVNNSSGYHGVSKRSNGKWRARITKDGNIINLGTFEKLEDAVEARQIAEIDILGYLADSEPISQKVTDKLSKLNSNLSQIVLDKLG